MPGIAEGGAAARIARIDQRHLHARRLQPERAGAANKPAANDQN